MRAALPSLLIASVLFSTQARACAQKPQDWSAEDYYNHSEVVLEGRFTGQVKDEYGPISGKIRVDHLIKGPRQKVYDIDEGGGIPYCTRSSGSSFFTAGIYKEINGIYYLGNNLDGTYSIIGRAYDLGLSSDLPKISGVTRDQEGVQ